MRGFLIDSVTGFVQIGEVADKLGVSTRTIKYYEELGSSSLGNAL